MIAFLQNPAPIDAPHPTISVESTGKERRASVMVHICKVGGEYDKYIYSPKKVERTINAFHIRS